MATVTFLNGSNMVKPFFVCLGSKDKKPSMNLKVPEVVLLIVSHS